MHMCFPILYREYWRAVLEVSLGAGGFLMEMAHGTFFAYDGRERPRHLALFSSVEVTARL